MWSSPDSPYLNDIDKKREDELADLKAQQENI